jgi:TetR/AcrR family transcriptional regulator
MPETTRTRRPAPRRRTARPADSQERILDAALKEFAARGFAGARVDRIAAAARLNKAMLYYHFGSKAGLYRTAIQHRLGTLASRLEAIASADKPPAQRLDLYIETLIRLGLQQPEFAPIMLREVAEGASHIDQDTARLMLRIVATMAVIVDAGKATGEFRDANPLLAYLTTVWPIMIYLASGPVRQVLFREAKLDTSGLEPERFIRHIQETSRRSLAAEPAQGRPRKKAATERAS